MDQVNLEVHLESLPLVIEKCVSCVSTVPTCAQIIEKESFFSPPCFSTFRLLFKDTHYWTDARYWLDLLWGVGNLNKDCRQNAFSALFAKPYPRRCQRTLCSVKSGYRRSLKRVPRRTSLVSSRISDGILEKKSKCVCLGRVPVFGVDVLLIVDRKKSQRTVRHCQHVSQ